MIRNLFPLETAKKRTASYTAVETLLSIIEMIELLTFHIDIHAAVV